MIKKYTFDEVYDTQTLFRLVLDGMANPFRRKDCSRIFDGFKPGDFPEIKALASLLLDPEVSFALLTNSELAEEIQELTGGKMVDPAYADYLFVLDSAEIKADLLAKLKHGTLDEPEKSCTLLVMLPEAERQTIRPQGPGIAPETVCQVESEALRIMQAEKSLRLPFPCGKDFVFIDGQQNIFCWPRTSRVEEVETWLM